MGNHISKSPLPAPESCSLNHKFSILQFLNRVPSLEYISMLVSVSSMYLVPRIINKSSVPGHRLKYNRRCQRNKFTPNVLYREFNKSISNVCAIKLKRIALFAHSTVSGNRSFFHTEIYFSLSAESIFQFFPLSSNAVQSAYNGTINKNKEKKKKKDCIIAFAIHKAYH